MTKQSLKERIDFSFFCAQDAFLSSGSFIPMLDISFRDNKEVKRAVVAISGEAVDSRLKILFSLGVIFGNYKNQGKVTEIENILMINEAWASKHNKNTNIDNVPMPSQDPNRMEMLICTGQTPDGTCLMKAKEIKRGMVESKIKIELKDIDNNYTSIQSNLLSKFYEGYDKVVSSGKIFKEEDMPMGESLKKLFN